MTKHNSFYFDVDGEWVHMQADPNMTPETENALIELVRAVRKMAADKPVYACSVCGELRTSAEGGVCTQCRIDRLRE